MSETQTVKELLNKFNLNLNLTDTILNMEIPDVFDSFQEKFDDVTGLGVYNSKFKFYLFENEEYICKIIPDYKDGSIGIYKIMGEGEFKKVIGRLYNGEGNVLSIT